MAHRGECTHCGGRDMYKYPKNLSLAQTIPIGSIFKGDNVDILACAACGHVAFFVAQRNLQVLREKWQRIV